MSASDAFRPTAKRPLRRRRRVAVLPSPPDPPRRFPLRRKPREAEPPPVVVECGLSAGQPITNRELEALERLLGADLFTFLSN